MNLLQTLSFGAPWVLAALAILPAIWWLLKVTPPAPRTEWFPAIRLLLGLNQTDQTPAHTPLWLLLLRMLAAAAIILALADPFVTPTGAKPGKGPIVIAVDNGWASATRWDGRAAALADIAQRAERAARPVIVLPTAESDVALELKPLVGADAQGAIKAITPQPYDVNRAKALEALRTMRFAEKPDVIWLADGLEDGNALAFADGLKAIGALTVFLDSEGNGPLALTPPVADGGKLRFDVLRAETQGEVKGSLRGMAADGRILGEAPFAIAPGQKRGSAHFELPSDMRNALARVEIADRASAGAVVLIDERWRRRPVGLISGQTVDTAQPLLSDLYYIERALSPYAELRKGTIQDLLNGGLSVLMIADVGQIVGEDQKAVAAWINNGGVLVRFSGPKMAAQTDEQIPGKLRTGGRLMGGAMSWEKPQALASFPEGSPFQGLPVRDDVKVGRQVLTDPIPGVTITSWAQLADGTPLVTAEQRGKGYLVLFHVTANAEWSNLPLSGLFLEMLRRIVAISAGVSDNVAAQTNATLLLQPVETLDGYGRLVPPPGQALPLQAAQFDSAKPGPRTPPGLYGEGGARRALNLHRTDSALNALPPMPRGIEILRFGGRTAFELKFWLLALAAVLILIDGIAALALRGLIVLPGIRPVAAGSAAAFVLFAFSLTSPQDAQADDSFAMKAALGTHLAYVVTGDPEVDAMTKSGMEGLSRVLRDRTAIEPDAPVGVNVETDELAFFPLIYWPIGPAQQDLSPAALSKIDAYMKNGGTIFFDTRDQAMTLDAGGVRSGPGTEILRRLLGGLDLPPLEALNPEHVMTKSFYLLQDFPGRWTGGKVWVEARGGAGGGPDAKLTQSDGVSPIVVGGHDWAAAWARDEFGRPLAAVSPGGEQQREMAYRFGVNLVMYALTGNYKADQVHVPAILERLGQ
jgi:hypothetical protein